MGDGQKHPINVHNAVFTRPKQSFFSKMLGRTKTTDFKLTHDMTLVILDELDKFWGELAVINEFGTEEERRIANVIIDYITRFELALNRLEKIIGMMHEL